MSRRHLSIVLVALATACHHRAPQSDADRAEAVGVRLALAPQLVEQVSHTTALLQAVSAANDSVAWVSGHRATWARTTDGGATWQSGAMSGRDSMLEFRDVHAVDANTAYLLAAGPGERSRIYKTTDAGRTWSLQFQNTDASAFYDCFDFWDANHGVAVSDAVNGRLVIIRTADGGSHWTRVSDADIPPAFEGEGAFAASGTCVITRGRATAFIAAAGPAGSRVYRSTDGGRRWSAFAVPLAGGQMAGIGSITFRDDRRGIAVGGAMVDTTARGENVVLTEDGGETWQSAGRTTFAGAAYGAVFVPGAGAVAVAAAPTGLDWTADGGRTWVSLNSNSYWSVGFASRRAGWAVGPRGRITKVTFSMPMAN